MKKFKLVALYVSASLLLWSCGSADSKPSILPEEGVKKLPTATSEKAEKPSIVRGQAVGTQPSRGISPTTLKSSGNRFAPKQAPQGVEKQSTVQTPLQVKYLPKNQEAPPAQKAPQVQESAQVQETPQVQKAPPVQAVQEARPDQETPSGQEASLVQETSKLQEQPQSEDGIVNVVGSKDFTNKVKAALKLIKEKDNAAYQRINTYLNKIVENENSGVDVYTKTFFLGKGTVSNGDVFWLAGVIVHDAYHSELFSLNKPFTGDEAEKACNQQQKATLKNIGAPDNYLTYLDEVSESNYWEVPFEQRGW